MSKKLFQTNQQNILNNYIGTESTDCIFLHVFTILFINKKFGGGLLLYPIVYILILNLFYNLHIRKKLEYYIFHLEFQMSGSMSGELFSVASSSTTVEDIIETKDAATTAESIYTDTNEQISPEYLQRKLYFILEHLKKMHSELPE